MSRNLNPEEKERIRDKYEECIFFRLVNQSCKKYEREMKLFRFSPEDVFVESLNVLDDLKAPNRNNDDLCCTLWDDLYCEFRERGDNLPDEELEKAVAVVISMVTYCLVLLNSMRYHGLVGKLNMIMTEHYHNYLEIQLSIDTSARKNNMGEFCLWLEDYMQCDKYLSEEIDECLEENEDVEEKENDGDSKIAPSKVRAKVLLEILKQCGLGLDKQEMTKVARLLGFILGSSSDYMRNIMTTNSGLTLNEKTHDKYLREINTLLSIMQSNIRIKCE